MQDRTAQITEKIVAKLLPWFRIKWLAFTETNVTVEITGIVCIIWFDSICRVFRITGEGSRTDLNEAQIKRLEATLNGGLRDDEGNIHVPATS